VTILDSAHVTGL